MSAPIRSQGLCHGFEVMSTLAHRFLAPGHGQPLTIEGIDRRTRARGPLVISWPGRRGRLQISVHSNGPGHYEVVTASLGIFDVDLVRPAVGVPAAADPLRREMLTFGPPLALLIDRSGDVAFHGAAVVFGQRAVVITGPGGSGKSTITGAALGRGLHVLSDDLCRLTIGETAHVYQGPAVVRLREASLPLIDLTAAELAGRGGGKTHLIPHAALDGARAFYPLAAIAVIHPESDRPSLAPVPAAAAIPELWRQTFFLPGDAEVETSFTRLAALADRVPVYHLGYPHRPDQIEGALTMLESIA